MARRAAYQPSCPVPATTDKHLADRASAALAKKSLESEEPWKAYASKFTSVIQATETSKVSNPDKGSLVIQLEKDNVLDIQNAETQECPDSQDVLVAGFEASLEELHVEVDVQEYTIPNSQPNPLHDSLPDSESQLPKDNGMLSLFLGPQATTSTNTRAKRNRKKPKRFECGDFVGGGGASSPAQKKKKKKTAKSAKKIAH